MRNEQPDLEEQIERCRRLRTFLTDSQLRDALEELAADYEARLKRRGDACDRPFMLRNRH
jgi:hypothetical protein